MFAVSGGEFPVKLSLDLPTGKPEVSARPAGRSSKAPKQLPYEFGKHYFQEQTMRNAVMTLAVGAALIFLSLGAASAAPVSAPQFAGETAIETVLQQVQYGGYCERLRERCKYKYELGEAGDGNCRRYREECGGGRRSYCERLRRACMFKEERGQVGEGNCRRYREECGR
jgi:hypothetical protein